MALLVWIVLALATATVAAQMHPLPRPTSDPTSTESRHEKESVSLLRSLQTNASEPLKVINPDKYIQHDLDVADGLTGLIAFQKVTVAAGAKVKKHRVFQDGNHVFLHMEYELFGPLTSFDVFRFERGQIVEHWDNLQFRPNKTNPSNHTMLDGPVHARNHHETKVNKEIVRNFTRDYRNATLAPTYFSGLIQHNPTVGDGYPAYAAYLSGTNVTAFTTVHQVLGEGDFVLVLSEGTLQGNATGFYDLFRLEHKKIVEHWDTVQTILPKNQWKNNNGKW